MTDNDRPTPVSGRKPVQLARTEGFIIHVGLRDHLDASLAALAIPTNLQYVSVEEDFADTITWILDVPENINAFFDNPAIEFVESTAPTPVRMSNTVVTVDWSNTNPALQGLSFHYRINVVIEIDSVLVPVNHDPTVHNDPPTP
jgi:hypothetical protein